MAMVLIFTTGNTAFSEFSSSSSSAGGGCGSDVVVASYCHVYNVKITTISAC